MNTSLRIALFEENPRLLALLRAILLLAGHTVSMCAKEGYPLVTFLQELVEELKQPCTPCYDLLIIDVSEAAPIAEILIPLERLMREQTIPMILLKEASDQTFEQLQANVAVVPVFFRTLVRMQELFVAIEVTTGVPFPCFDRSNNCNVSNIRPPFRLSKPGLRLAAHGSTNARNGSPSGKIGWVNGWSG